jgi:hypothetical protein
MAVAEKQTEAHLDLKDSIPRPRKSDDHIHMSPTKKILLILFAIVIAGFIILYGFSPSNLKIHVTDVSLAQFNLTTNNAHLHFNLALNISIRNPNKRIGLYYRAY